MPPQTFPVFIPGMVWIGIPGSICSALSRNHVWEADPIWFFLDQSSPGARPRELLDIFCSLSPLVLSKTPGIIPFPSPSDFPEKSAAKNAVGVGHEMSL